MTPPATDERLQRALERFVSQGAPFVLPAGDPPTVLLPEPPGGLPPSPGAHAALTNTQSRTPLPPSLAARPPRRASLPDQTPQPRTHRAVVTADAVLPSLDHVLWSVSPDGRLVYLLGGPVERLLGQPAEYFLDKPDGWLHAVTEDDRPVVRAAFARLPTAGAFAVEHRVCGRQVVSRGRLVRRPDGTPVRVDGTTTEVTESAAERELRAKLAAADEKLRDAAQLATAGRLAAGVAHDFNNCLTVISGHAQLLRDLLPHDDPLREPAAEIVSHVAAAAAVARQLVAVGRPAAADSAGPTDPSAEVRGLERLLRRVAGDAITLDLLIPPAVPPVRVGAGAMVQIVLNLVANARDATPGRGTITVRTAETFVDRSRPDWPAALPGGRYVALTVTDTGVGMSDGVRARAFDPYFTTKGAAGSGVGLASVAEIVRAAGGHIEVESTECWGTSVRVFLPPADAPAAPTPPPPTTARGGTETVLLVQDGTAVRDLAATALQHAGYRVLEADDGAGGEERARLYAGPIDLLVTDVGLPKQDGHALAAVLRAARPGLKVLFVSGTAATGPGAFLAKPYAPEELLAAVRRALDAPG